MKAVTFVEVGRVDVRDVDKPTIQEPTDVLLKVTTTAICGSDLHILEGRTPGFFDGSIIGHEFVGVIEDAGPEVKKFKPGQRALASFLVPCGDCWYCARGLGGQCQDAVLFGGGLFAGNLAGGQAEYVRVPNADVGLHALDDSMPDEQALFAGDILSTGVQVVLNANIKEGDSVAVIGCGPVGLFAIQAARAFKPSAVYGVDSVEQRLEMAQGFGAIPVSLTRQNATVALQEATDDRGVDVVLECVGNTKALVPAFDMVRPGGTISVIGLHTETEATIPLQLVFLKAIDLKFGGFANPVGQWDRALKMVEDGTIDPTAIISHRMKLEDAVKGYELFQAREAMKVVLTP